METCLKHHFAYPNVTAGATRGSVRNHACAIVPTVLLRALIIKAQSCRRAHIISNENLFIHDVPRGGAVSLGRRRAAVRGGAEQRRDRAPPPTLCQVPTVCQVPYPSLGLNRRRFNRGGRHGAAKRRHGAILPPVKSTHGEGGSPGAKISRHGRGAKKWLNFKKTAAGHVEKKKNGTVNISETSRVARGRGPPAP